MNTTVFIILSILVVGLLVPLIFKSLKIGVPLFIETFVGANHHNIGGSYPYTDNTVLLQNVYPVTYINSVSNANSDIGLLFPDAEVGSYAQVTNNPPLKDRDGPEDGSCTPSEFCFALYNQKKDIR
jgi:hypothetical protein